MPTVTRFDPVPLVMLIAYEPERVTDENRSVPHWKPLEAVLPLEGLGDWMFMGRDTSAEGIPIVLYKHSGTRRYVVLDDKLNVYQYDYGHHNRINAPSGRLDALYAVLTCALHELGREISGERYDTDPTWRRKRDAALRIWFSTLDN